MRSLRKLLVLPPAAGHADRLRRPPSLPWVGPRAAGPKRLGGGLPHGRVGGSGRVLHCRRCLRLCIKTLQPRAHGPCSAIPAPHHTSSAIRASSSSRFASHTAAISSQRSRVARSSAFRRRITTLRHKARQVKCRKGSRKHCEHRAHASGRGDCAEERRSGRTTRTRDLPTAAPTVASPNQLSSPPCPPPSPPAKANLHEQRRACPAATRPRPLTGPCPTSATPCMRH